MKREIPIFILCGGLGTRLKELTKECPKPLLRVHERPFLDYLISYFIKNGFKNITLLCHYKAEQFLTYREHLAKYGFNIKVHIENELKGTAGAICEAINLLADHAPEIICCNGDTLSNIDLDHFINSSNSNTLTMALCNINQDQGRFGKVEIDEKKKVVRFLEKENNTSTLINCGLYHIPRSLFPYFQTGKTSLEYDIFPLLIEQKLLSAFCQKDGNFIDIGIPEDYNLANRNFKHSELAF